MELDRERERERALQRVVAVTTAVPVVAATPTRPRRGPPPNGAHAQAPRSMAGEKRQSPEGDDDDDDYGEGGLNDAARALAVGHPPKRASVGAQSTGDDTVDYMSSALSVNDESRADSLQDSPTSHVTPRSSDEDRGDNPEREPPAAGTRSKTGSAARPGPGACATPASVALPSSSRPSQPRPQPRPQRSVAR
ncbi:hypothetical protein H4R21_006154 [Coemansia helicoidea]|uniref:Uncharacterized protein n=2 Tax=Coemansia TaxID=4863 RepID=A0ACC1KP90_9FUNG|nr:hypothetical protein H4R21_006154 [Coemansia helicoidea]